MNYSHLNTKTTKRLELLNYVKSSTDWFISNGFKILRIPDKFLEDQMIDLKKHFGGYAIVFEMSPFTFYKFHVDEKRKCAVNLLLSGFDSHCYYGEITECEEVIENVSELHYETDRYCLLNTKRKHAIMNRGDYRYLLSIGFNDHDYDTIKQHCLENNL